MALVAMMLSTLGRSSGYIEVPQRNRGQSVGPEIVFKNPFSNQLGLAVGIEGNWSGSLAYGHLIGNTVDGSGGGKDDFLDAEFYHCVQECQETSDIVAIVASRFPHGLLYQGKGREMDDTVDFKLGEDVPGCISIGQVSFKQRYMMWHSVGMTFSEVVQHHHLESLRHHQLNCDTSDVARTAGDQDFLHTVAPQPDRTGTPVDSPMVFTTCRRTCICQENQITETDLTFWAPHPYLLILESLSQKQVGTCLGGRLCRPDTVQPRKSIANR